jgi:hypothetical protein
MKRKNRGLSRHQRAWISPPKDRRWVRMFVDVIQGEAWRGLSVNARRVHDALTCQHFRYEQRDNGDLQISYRGFERARVTERMVAPAIRELIAAGFITTRQGISPNGIMRPPTLYGLVVYAKAGVVKTASRPFVFVPVEVMESAEWSGLSINARRIMDRLLFENFRHRAEENGALQVSFRQFAMCGVRFQSGCHAVKELVEAGLLVVTRGQAKNSQCAPNVYRITFLGTLDGPPIWRNAAENNAETATENEQKMPPKKTFPTPRSGNGATPITGSGESRFPPPDPVAVRATRPPPDPVTPIRSSGIAFERSPTPRPTNGATFPLQNPNPEPEKQRAAFFCAKSAREATQKAVDRLIRDTLAELSPGRASKRGLVVVLSGERTRAN